MLKGWVGAGVVFAILGSLLMWYGLTERFHREPVALTAKPIMSASGDASAATLLRQTSPAPSLPSAGNLATTATHDTSKAPSRGLSEVAILETRPSRVERPVSAASIPEIRTTFDLPQLSDRYKDLLLKKLKADGWSEDELKLLVGYLSDIRAQFQPEILRINATHTETEAQYAHHLTPESVNRCLEVWGVEGEKIRRAVEGRGVPPEVVMAILKVETNYGNYRGKESVFNVYWSLALGDEPAIVNEVLDRTDADAAEKRTRMERRSKFARSQLRDLLYMANKEAGKDPVGIMGSWAGAFGLSQFIPASYRAYGRDGNGDGVVDLDDFSDAAASIAHYLRLNGWPADGSQSREHKAIMAYNHSDPYADCVLALADSIAQRCSDLRR